MDVEWWRVGFGGRPGLHLPETQMLEDLLYLPAIAFATLS
jgi:hypothetical protein